MSEVPTIVFLEVAEGPSPHHDSDFTSRVRVLASGFGALVVDSSSQAVTLCAKSAGSAIDLAATVVSEVGGSRFYPEVRAGLDTPVALEGLAQSQAHAQAVSAMALPGQVLLTDATRESAGRLWSVQLHDVGKRLLEPGSDEVALWAAVKKSRCYGPPR